MSLNAIKTSVTSNVINLFYFCSRKGLQNRAEMVQRSPDAGPVPLTHHFIFPFKSQDTTLFAVFLTCSEMKTLVVPLLWSFIFHRVVLKVFLLVCFYNSRIIITGGQTHCIYSLPEEKTSYFISIITKLKLPFQISPVQNKRKKTNFGFILSNTWNRKYSCAEESTCRFYFPVHSKAMK